LAQGIRKNILIAGHVDHGKSTLIGRILKDTNSLNSIQEKEKDLAHITDGFSKERIEAKTIDTTQVFFSHEDNDYCLIDVPGHFEYLRGAITGMTEAGIAIIICDVNEGIKEQTECHLRLTKLVGIKKILVVINKIDTATEEHFEEVRNNFEKLCIDIGYNEQSFSIIPVSALTGLNITTSNLLWFKGPTLLECLKVIEAKEKRATTPAFIVQGAYNNKTAIYILQGTIKPQELFYNATDNYTISIDDFVGENRCGEAKSCPLINITDKEFLVPYLQRGSVWTNFFSQSVIADTVSINTTTVWLSKTPINKEATYRIHSGCQTSLCNIKSIKEVYETNSLHKRIDNYTLAFSNIGNVQFHLEEPLTLTSKYPELSHFIIEDNGEIVGGGIVND